MKVKVKGQGHHIIKRDFEGLSMVYLNCGLEFKVHRGQGQRSHGSRTKVKVVGQRSRSACEENPCFSRTLHLVFDM